LGSAVTGLEWTSSNSRVAHALPFMYAPHEHGQHLCHHVPPVACSGILTGADMKSNVGATRELQTCVSSLGGSCPMGMGARYSQSAVKPALYRNNLQRAQTCDRMKGLSWFCHLCWQAPARGFTAGVSTASLIA